MSDLRPTIIWLNSLLIVLTLAAVVSRAGRRIFVVGKFGWHDGLIVLAAVSATIFSIFQMVSTGLGLGDHQGNVNPAHMPKLNKLLLASNAFYFLCNWAIKHALLFFYREITTERSHRVSIYFMHCIAFGFGLSSILVDVFRCRPFRKAFYPDVQGYCVNLDAFYYYNSSMMLCTDLVLYVMPVVFTRKLMLRRPQRVGLNCLFALGVLVLVASAARIWSIHMFVTRPDFTFRFAVIMIWSVVENHIAVVVACAPSIKVIAALVFPRLASSLGKFASLISPSGSRSSRSKSRSSIPLEIGEAGNASRQSGTMKTSVISTRDELRATPAGTPLPSPVYSANSISSRANRHSRSFSQWFSGPVSRADSTEDMGLVYVEHTFTIERSSRDRAS